MTGSVPSTTDAVVHVLLVEDDPGIAFAIRDMLESEGYDVRHADSGAHARQMLDEPAPDLVILDLMLPDTDGLILCADLKSRLNVPVIICSATNRKRDAVLALKLGADDFIAKPFDVDEFLTRVAAVLRRAHLGGIAALGVRQATAASADGSVPEPASTETSRAAGQAAGSLTVGPLTLEHTRRRVTFNGADVSLTPTEYRLLATFMARPDEVLTRQELAQVVWGFEDAAIGRSIDVHVHRLRAKLQTAEERAGVPGPTVVSVRGFGYKLLRELNGSAAA